MSILSFLCKLFKGNKSMAAVDFTGMSAKLDKLDIYVAAMKDELATAASNADKAAQLQSALDAANADLATSQAAEAAAETKLQVTLDAMAAPVETPAAA